MTYNEYAQLLEATNPDTGELYQPEDFNVIDWNEVGTAMLQDAIWADTERLESDEEYADTAVKLIQGAILGWIDQRDDPQAAADAVTAAGSTLGTSHQLWMANEINKLIWPSTERRRAHRRGRVGRRPSRSPSPPKNKTGAPGHHRPSRPRRRTRTSTSSRRSTSSRPTTSTSRARTTSPSRSPSTRAATRSDAGRVARRGGAYRDLPADLDTRRPARGATRPAAN